MLEEFASTNRLNLLMPDDRHHAAVFMEYVLKKAPVLHISFASEATRKFTTEIVVWLRTNYDSEMLIEIGLEPGIAAGCVVRTTNKMFDFSLIKHLREQRSLLMEKLLGATSRPLIVVPAPPVVPAPETPQGVVNG
jgi:F0F1-type ATP synthase delta subunit